MSPRPAKEVDLQDSAVVIDLFQQACELNLTTGGRQGAVADLQRSGRLLMTGDLHDHGLNFHRILKLARLQESAHNHLILHEIVHGPSRVNGRDLSIRMLARAAALKCAYPEQVLILQSNHELAQLLGERISKDSGNLIEAFNAGIDFLYVDDAEYVQEAMNQFLRSLLLAVRCANGVLFSHSLPSPRRLEQFDPQVLTRVPTDEDLGSGGSAYLMVWGRNHTQQVSDLLTEKWGARQFVMGHQPAEMGFEPVANNMIILASDHDHGVALPIDLAQHYEQDDLIDQIVPLASVVI